MFLLKVIKYKSIILSNLIEELYLLSNILHETIFTN